ncbi:lipopolysaccharide biosynthesis protein [Faecalimonas sp. LCP19S3_D12]
MRKSEELVKNTAIISIGKLGTQVVNFFLLPLYTARIKTETYGDFDFVTSVAGFIVPIMTFLMEESMFQFLIDCKNDDERKQVISRTFIFCILNSLLISIIGGIITFVTGYKLGYAIILYSTAMVLTALSNALARGLGKIALYSFSNFLTSIGVIVMNLILILGLDLQFSALLISGVISYSLSAIYVMIRLKVWKFLDFKALKKNEMKNMLSFSFPLIPNTISWNVISVSDRLIIMNFSGASANGLYSIAYKFPNLINTFYNFFNIAWKETSAKIVRDNDVKYFENIFYRVKTLLASVTMLLITGIHIIYPIFINENYYQSIYYVPILAVSVFYMAMAAFYGGIFTAYKDTRILGLTSFWAAGINLFTNIALYRFIGVYAAAISTLLAAFFLCIYRRCKMKKYVNIKYKYEGLVEVLFLLSFLSFYRGSDTVKLIVFISCAIVSAYINKDFISVVQTRIKKKK